MSWISFNNNNYISDLRDCLRNTEWKDEDNKKFTVEGVWSDYNEVVVELRNNKETRKELIMAWAGNSVLRTFDPEYGVITDWKSC